MDASSSDAAATVPTARLLELPNTAYSSGGTKLESSSSAQDKTKNTINVRGINAHPVVVTGQESTEEERGATAGRRVRAYRGR